MEALIVLLLLVVAVVVFVFPIWAILRIRSQGENLVRLENQLDAMRDEIRRQPTRPPPVQPTPAIAPVIPGFARNEVQEPVPPVIPAPAAPIISRLILPTEETTVATESSVVPTPVASSTPPPIPTQDSPPPAYVPPARRRAAVINWEQFMGVKLFLWLGGLALFLGAVFFVKLSIEQGWIPLEVRIALGFLLGIGLVVGGVILSRKRYATQGQALCATGIVTLYAMAFACRSFYGSGFFGPGATLALMVLITTTAFLLAVRLDARVVALLGMLGGFLTPRLLASGHDNPLGLFTYIALLDLGLIAVALHRRWHFLVPLAALGTAVMQIGWATTFLNNQKTLTAMVVCLTFDVLFLAGVGVARARQQTSKLLSLPVAGLVFLSFAFAWHLGANTPAGLQPGRWLSFIFLADLCILGLVLLDVTTARLHVIAGTVVFALLGAWTFQRVDAGLLPWALAGYLMFAVLHSAFPLVLRHLRPEMKPDRWYQLFTPLAMLLVLGPVLNSPYVSSAIWPAILLLDLLAIGLAWVTASLAPLILVLILTLCAAGQSIFRIPSDHGGGSLLLIIGGFAVLFFAAGLGLSKRLRRTLSTGTSGAPSVETATLLPSLSSLLPFILLVMATGRLSMPSPSPVFGLALLLVAMSLGLARLLALGALPACALGGVLALCYTWQGTHHTLLTAGSSIPLLWYLGFYAVFTAFPFFNHRAFAGLRGPWLASAAAGPLFFPLIFEWVKRSWPSFSEVMGLLPAAFALPALACVIAVVRMDPIDHPRRLGRLALFGGVALLFITLIFPIQFDQHREWITIAWALEGAAVLWLYHRVPHRGLPIAGLLLLVTAFARLALNPAVVSYHLRGQTPIFNWYLYTYGLVVICLLVSAKLLAPPRNQVLGFNAPPWLQTFAGVLLFFLLNIEIADYFTSAHSPLDFKLSGSFARDLAYTICWALYAFALLIVGLWKRARGPRYAALGLLGVTLLKLFILDLARLDQLYRIGALVGVAVIAILASFLYQRFLPPDEKKPSPAP